MYITQKILPRDLLNLFPNYANFYRYLVQKLCLLTSLPPCTTLFDNHGLRPSDCFGSFTFVLFRPYCCMLHYMLFCQAKFVKNKRQERCYSDHYLSSARFFNLQFPLFICYVSLVNYYALDDVASCSP